MRVALVSGLFPPHVVGGAEIVTAQLAEGLTARGHEVHVFTLGSRHQDPAIIEENDTAHGHITRFASVGLWWRMEEAPGRVRKMDWRLRNYRNFRQERTMARTIAQWSPDIIHTHNLDGIGAGLWAALARQTSAPIIHTAHDFQARCVRRNLMTPAGRPCNHSTPMCRAHRYYWRKQARNLSRIVAPSKFLAQEVQESLQDQIAIQRIPNAYAGTSTHASQPASRHVRIAYVGQMTEHKGIAGLLNIIAERGIPPNAGLDLVGRGPLLNTAKQAAQRTERMQVHGWLTDSQRDAILHEAQVFIHCSLWPENAPLAVLDAMAHGLAVVGFDVGGVGEIARHGVEAILAQEGDFEQLWDNVTALCDDNHRRAEMIQAGLARANEFTKDRFIDAHEETYREVLNQGHR